MQAGCGIKVQHVSVAQNVSGARASGGVMIHLRGLCNAIVLEAKSAEAALVDGVSFLCLCLCLTVSSYTVSHLAAITGRRSDPWATCCTSRLRVDPLHV